MRARTKRVDTGSLLVSDMDQNFMNYDLKYLSENDLTVVYQTFMAAFSAYVQDGRQVTETSFTTD